MDSKDSIFKNYLYFSTQLYGVTSSIKRKDATDIFYNHNGGSGIFCV